MKRSAWVLVPALALALAACGRDKDQSPDAASGVVPDGGDAGEATAPAELDGAVDGGVDAFALPASCAGAATPPTTLVCTGLYADVASKTLAPGVEAYAPAVPLWSDGASKQRWISLPAGTKIDNTNPDEWVFPVGTKLWKEFSKDGKRVETRLWQKVSATFWVNATYAWNADESAATRSDGGDIPWNGGTYHIPTNDECQKCHRGRTDHILGFDQVLLGMAGAQGMTLGRLVVEGRLTKPPATTTLVIGDDGTALAAPALAWLHVNCGTTCHNRNSNATAWSTGMFLRLDPTMLDGRSVKGFDTLATTIGVAVTSPNWPGRTRIIPRDPAKSLLYQLISHRGTGNQMPPIATSVVDAADIPLVEAWIAELPALAAPADAGADVHEARDAGAREVAAEAPPAEVASSSDAPDALDVLDALDAPDVLDATDAPDALDAGTPDAASE